MAPLRRNLSLHRWCAAWLLALVLGARLLVPSGFMPMAGHAGLEICAGQTLGLKGPAPTAAGMAGAHFMAMDHADHGKSMPGGQSHDCGFAGAVGAMGQLPTVILPRSLAPFAAPIRFVASRVIAPGRGLAAPPPPKTGPPLTLR